MGQLLRGSCPNKLKWRAAMKNNIYYFIIGFLTSLLISCNISPLEANMSSECGLNEWNPCYVKVVQ